MVSATTLPTMDSNLLLQDFLNLCLLLYQILKPIVVLYLATVLIACCGGAKLTDASRTLVAYLMKGIGIVLMTVGAVPTILAVMTTGFSAAMYLGLLLVFAAGGLLFLWFDHQTREMKSAQTSHAASLYAGLLSLAGCAIVLYALSLIHI